MMQMTLQDEHMLRLTGELVFNRVFPMCQPGEELILQKENLIVDLKEVLHCDSAGLAMLLTWAKVAKNNQRSLQFVNPPSQLLNLAKIIGADSVLGLSPA